MIDVVICGNIRSELALYEVLGEVLDARSEGLVGQIVFSTWNSERAAFPRLFKAIEHCGIDVVGCEPPSPYNVSIVLQQLQFWRGMQALTQPDGWVFRTRTEKALLHTRNLFDAIRAKRFDVDHLSSPAAIYERQVAVFALSLTEPFAHDDLAFVARRRDALRLLSFDAAYDYIFNDSGYFPQEARWFAAPIMARHPELKPFFRALNIHRLCAAIRRAGEQGTLAEAPEAVMQYLAANWSLSHDLFALVDRSAFGPAPPFSDFLARRAERPFAVSWGDRLMATSQEWFDFLATGSGTDDPVLARISRHQITPNAYGQTLASLDLEALAAFADRGQPVVKPAPRFDRAPSHPDAVDRQALFEAMFDPPLSANTAGALFESAQTDLGEERGTVGIHGATLPRARALAAEARESGDRDKAGAAFVLALSAAWGRVAEAVDVACSLGFDGLLSPEQRRRAFETVYTIHVTQPESPIGHYWYGVGHIYGYVGALDHEHGLSLVQRAADLGMKRALTFLADWPEDSARPDRWA